MSFSSLLAKIKNKPSSDVDSPIPYTASSATKSAKQVQADNKALQKSSSYDTSVIKKADPAVQRLKELRRQEKEEKDAAAKAKSKEQSAARPKQRARSAPAVKPTRLAQTTNKQYDSSPNRSLSPPKRLTFKELMEEAKGKTKSLNESSKDSTLKPAEHFVSKTQPKQPQRKSVPPISKRPLSSTKLTPTRRSIPTNAAIPKARIIAPTTPKPLAQPSAKLKAKLEARKKNAVVRQPVSKRKPVYVDEPEEEEDGGYRRRRYQDEDDESEDDFIVDDEEEEEEIAEDVGYDRDEIWKMFNKGKSRLSYRDYDDDLSDMEATGSEILREEDRAAKRARLEEIEETEREKRRVAEKKRRLAARR